MELTYYTTTYKGNKKETKEEHHVFVDDRGEENQLINLYPQITMQKIEDLVEQLRIQLDMSIPC